MYRNLLNLIHLIYTTIDYEICPQCNTDEAKLLIGFNDMRYALYGDTSDNTNEQWINRSHKLWYQYNVYKKLQFNGPAVGECNSDWCNDEGMPHCI